VRKQFCIEALRRRLAEEKSTDKNTLDKPRAPTPSSKSIMSQPANDNIIAPSEQKHVTSLTIAVDLVLVAVFFFFMFGWVKPHVPAYDPKWVNLFGALTAISVTGVFWLAIQMFRVVVAGEKRLRAERAAKR
jgi:hypothetical protein